MARAPKPSAGRLPPPDLPATKPLGGADEGPNRANVAKCKESVCIKSTGRILRASVPRRGFRYGAGGPYGLLP